MRVRSKNPASKDRANKVDRARPDAQAAGRRSGEGSESALKTLKKIELDRQRARPKEDSGSPK